jgi:hypothetical protein
METVQHHISDCSHVTPLPINFTPLYNHSSYKTIYMFRLIHCHNQPDYKNKTEILTVCFCFYIQLDDDYILAETCTNFV